MKRSLALVLLGLVAIVLFVRYNSPASPPPPTEEEMGTPYETTIEGVLAGLPSCEKLRKEYKEGHCREGDAVAMIQHVTIRVSDPKEN